MKKKEIIKDSNEFTKMINNCHYIKTKNFTIYYNEKENSIPKFGITISNKSGNAVTRNLMKRRIKAIIDNNKSLFKNNEKYIIIIKAIAVTRKYEELECDLVAAMKERKL